MDSSSNCSYVAKGNTEGEVISSMMDHMRKAHPEKMKSGSEQDMMDMMKPKIKEE